MKRFFSAAMVVVFLFSSCSRNVSQRFARETTAMDTYLSVTIYDEELTKTRAEELIDLAFAEVNRIEAIMTDYADTSEVGMINIHAGKDTVSVSDELTGLLKRSLAFSDQSGGAFDMSVGALVKAWDFLSSDPEIPPAGKIRMLLRLTGYRKVSLDGTKVFLDSRGMRIDLGAIAKGYAVDKTVEVLKRNGVRHAIVDLGGNLGVWWEGTHALDTTVAEILIRHPRKEGKFFASLKAGTCGIATSGDYQRYFIKNGIRYHHILNPATGFPASGVVSVTIIAEDATTADALSTLVFVLGRERGMEFIKHRERVEGVIVWEEGDVLHYDLSPGLVGKLKRTDD